MKRVAVATYCHNESFHLPVWCNYYGKIFGRDNLFVLDDGSTDDTISKLGLKNVFHFPKAVHNNRRRVSLIASFANFMLGLYDWFIYTDTDEILLVDPARHGSLLEYIDNLDREYVTAIGLDVVHNYRVESALDPEKPILEQRQYALFNPGFCKPLITRVPLRWTGGFHFCNRPPTFHDLYLFHNKFVDFDLTLQRHRLNHTIERVGAKANIWRQSEDDFREQFAAMIDRPVTEAFSFEDYTTRFSEDVARNDAGFFIRTRTMQRGRELHRIPKRFAGLV